jgi:hypothetical protein
MIGVSSDKRRPLHLPRRMPASVHPPSTRSTAQCPIRHVLPLEANLQSELPNPLGVRVALTGFNNSLRSSCNTPHRWDSGSTRKFIGAESDEPGPPLRSGPGASRSPVGRPGRFGDRPTLRRYATCRSRP